MTKKRLIILLVVLACVAVGYSILRQTAQTTVRYVATESHFQATFPHKPKHAVSKIPFRTPKETVHYDSYVAISDDQTLYLLTTATYPVTPDPKHSLQAFIQQLAGNSSNTRVVKEEETSFQNYPALDFTLVNKDFWTYGRAVLANNRVFILINSNGSEALAQKNFHTFAESLVIK